MRHLKHNNTTQRWGIIAKQFGWIAEMVFITAIEVWPITDCSMSLAYGPSVKAFLRRGTAWAAMGSYWLAIQDYKHALEYEPANRDCIKGIDCALTTLDDQTRALVLDAPANGQLLATSHKIKEEFKALAALRAVAEQQVKVEVKANPQTVKSSEATAKQPPATKPQHSDFAKLQEMLSRFTTMIAADKLNTGALMGRADIYIQLGDIDKAMADYHFGLKLDPDNPELLKRWHAVKKKKGA
jgi:tetratricopeptide (TPR) repeat protein